MKGWCASFQFARTSHERAPNTPRKRSVRGATSSAVSEGQAKRPGRGNPSRTDVHARRMTMQMSVETSNGRRLVARFGSDVDAPQIDADADVHLRSALLEAWLGTLRPGQPWRRMSASTHHRHGRRGNRNGDQALGRADPRAGEGRRDAAVVAVQGGRDRPLAAGGSIPSPIPRFARRSITAFQRPPSVGAWSPQSGNPSDAQSPAVRVALSPEVAEALPESRAEAQRPLRMARGRPHHPRSARRVRARPSRSNHRMRDERRRRGPHPSGRRRAGGRHRRRGGDGPPPAPDRLYDVGEAATTLGIQRSKLSTG